MVRFEAMPDQKKGKGKSAKKGKGKEPSFQNDETLVFNVRQTDETQQSLPPITIADGVYRKEK